MLKLNERHFRSLIREVLSLYRTKNYRTGKILSKSICIVLISLLLSTALAGCYFFPKEEEVLAPPIKLPEKITYDTLEVTRGTIENVIRVNGNFVSINQKDLYYVKSDRLKEIYITPGQEVKKGELLAELENDSLLNEIQLQEIALKRSQIVYEDAKANYEIVGGSRTSLDLAELDLEANRIRLERLKTELEKCKLVSPIDGTVVYVANVRQGDYVNAYQTIVRVADPSQLQLRYSGDRVTVFRLGMDVVVEINNKQYEAEIVMTPAEAPDDADEETRKSVLIDVHELPEGIRLGQLASIMLTLERKEDVIVIPKLLVNSFANRKFVNVLKDDIREERDIEIGIQTNTEVEVVKGLQEGELLIMR